MTKPSYEELERLCECGYPRRMHGDPLTACCGKYKAASDINEEGKLLHLIQLAVCDPVEAVKGNMPSPAKAVEMIIDKVYQAGIKVADMTMEVAYAKGREEAAYEQVSKYWKRVEAVEAELNTLANTVEVERQRRFLRCPNTSSSHTTSCSTWGDDGRGHTAENFPTPLPCNCGALENFQRARAHVAESELARVRGLLQRYGGHESTCEDSWGGECDCGWDATSKSGAESADIGKLDTADDEHRVQGKVIHCKPLKSGSAETGGEKADEVCPICGTLDYGCCPAVAIGDPWVCLKHRVHRRDFGEDLADMVKAFPTVPRSSQNQTVSTGVEGAHAGTTADKSGEPEKLNNACPFCKQPYRLVGLSTVCGCMAESSLSSPPHLDDE